MKTKININKSFLIILAIILATSCSDFLDVVPDDIATIEDAFDDQNSAKSYLYTCYSWMPNLGNQSNNPTFYGGDEVLIDPTNLAAISNLTNINLWNIALGEQNVDTPLADYWTGNGGGKNMYNGIRDCNIFIENIDNVISIELSERLRWKAEAKFLKAYYHFYLFRMYGPIILVDENISIDAPTNEFQQFRSTVDECVTFIADLFREAADDLPNIITDRELELGRATKPAAYAMRARVLTYAASPLFNGNGDYSSLVDKRGISLFPQTFDETKWQVAAEACKQAIDTAEASGATLFRFDPNEIALPSGQSVADVPEEIINVLTIQQSLSERWTEEKLFVSTEGRAGGGLQNQAQARTHTRFSNNINVGCNFSPPLRIAEMFYTKNGVPIDEDTTWDYENRYQLRNYTTATDTDTNGNGVPDNQYYVKNGETTINLHFDREVRFYGSLGFDRGIWYGNPAVYNGSTNAGYEDHYLEGRGASEYSGTNQGAGRRSSTGYYAKKVTNFNNTIRHDGNGTSVRDYPFPEIRLADLYLLYAECLNEVGDITAAQINIDIVRERAGLDGVAASWANFSSQPDKPSNKVGLRDIIQQERMIELAFEGQRFWDLRRWKLAEQYYNQPYKGWNIEAETPEDYYIPVTGLVRSFSFKEYLWPIRTNEILTNPNLIQNVGW
ncbi:RagB/SusD family nutrient uptake outer membrane protein [Seonamhaeicola sp.]|uniref:RagB/SusD family nutrient uptake outer membrane protein n=1 Tax=Seonamhaeicola sp. TaxID=1912245 RepID=UPI002635B2C2|nr:RagB/SusD family nutrient uptake outer membrane protein [Seonamhaeicola sp.]